MTRAFEETLNLPHLDDLLKDEGVLARAGEVSEPETPSQGGSFDHTLQLAERTLEMVEGKDHSEKMDTVYKDTLKHAQDIMDLGFNIDHARAARMFEVGATMYKVAVDAANAKRDAQLKAMKLAIDQQRLELDKQQMGVAVQQTMETGTIMHEDRNELIKRLREQAKAERDE